MLEGAQHLDWLQLLALPAQAIDDLLCICLCQRCARCTCCTEGVYLTVCILFVWPVMGSPCLDTSERRQDRRQLLCRSAAQFQQARGKCAKKFPECTIYLDHGLLRGCDCMEGSPPCTLESNREYISSSSPPFSSTNATKVFKASLSRVRPASKNAACTCLFTVAILSSHQTLHSTHAG